MEINWKTSGLFLAGSAVGGYVAEAIHRKPSVVAAFYGSINLIANLALSRLILSERCLGKHFARCPWYWSVTVSAFAFCSLTKLTVQILTQEKFSSALRVTFGSAFGSCIALTMLGAITGKDPFHA